VEERATRPFQARFAAVAVRASRRDFHCPSLDRGRDNATRPHLLNHTVKNACTASICNLEVRNYRLRLFKNAWMQGPRNPEERGVLWAYVERRGMRETPQTGIFQQPDKNKTRRD
jgi:hypothetical protein